MSSPEFKQSEPANKAGEEQTTPTFLGDSNDLILHLRRLLAKREEDELLQALEQIHGVPGIVYGLFYFGALEKEETETLANAIRQLSQHPPIKISVEGTGYDVTIYLYNNSMGIKIIALSAHDIVIQPLDQKEIYRLLANEIER